MFSPNLVLVRHGESVWNKQGIFTGWIDIDLSKHGEQEAKRVGRLLKSYQFDKAYTSVLKRAIHTLWLLLESKHDYTLPIIFSWRLNERHYGALQGKSKAAVAEEFGKKQFLAWRRSFSERPPRAQARDMKGQTQLKELSVADQPRTESLEDTYKRVMPYWQKELLPALQRGEKLLVVAHGNSLRALVKHLEGISNSKIAQLEIPTGQPWCYQISPQGKVIKKRILKA